MERNDYFWWWFLSLIGFLVGIIVYHLSGKPPILFVLAPLGGFFCFPLLFIKLWATAQRFGVVAKVYRSSAVWKMRIWASRPLWGYKRPQVFANFAICALLGIHLVWFHEVFSSVPRVDRSVVNSGLRVHSERVQETVMRITRSDRITPEVAQPIQLPYPRIYVELSGSIPSSPISSNIQTPFGEVQFRRLKCLQPQVNEQPTCELSMRLPVYFGIGPAGDPRNLAKEDAIYASSPRILLAGLAGLELGFSHTNDHFQIKGLTEGPLSKERRKAFVSDLIKVEFDTAGRRIPDIQGLGKLTPKKFDEFVLGRENASLVISANNESYSEKVRLYCDLVSENSAACVSASSTDAELQTCGEGLDLSQHYCGYAGSYKFSSGLFSTWRSPSVNQITRHEAQVQFFYPINSIEDRSFLALFARSQGRNLALEPDEIVYLSRLKQQIVEDYSTILKFDVSSEGAEDVEAIEQALIRQPQLYPYYRDREFWGPIIEKKLLKQLSSIGFM